jgi:hypothetical protein
VQRKPQLINKKKELPTKKYKSAKPLSNLPLNPENFIANVRGYL